MTKKKWITGLILISCGIIAILFQRVWSGHTDIVAGNISYTYDCAWVDWKHARTGGIIKFVDEFNQKFDQTPLNETFNITYGQQGGFRQMGYLLYSYGISKEYEVLKYSNDETTKKKLMFQIFKDVCYLFENQQKEVFLGILKSSAFRDGDLMGNLIGFYLACGEMTREEAFELCGASPISIALQLKAEGKFKTNDTFIPKYEIITNSNPPIFPTQLTKYNNLEGDENYITPLEEKKNARFFNQDIPQ